MSIHINTDLWYDKTEILDVIEDLKGIKMELFSAEQAFALDKAIDILYEIAQNTEG